jgi:AI-2 transport protein TqsA
MAAEHGLQAHIGIITTVVVMAALYLAQPVMEPLAFALFIIALMWPIQTYLQARMPKLLALAITLAITVFVMALLGGLIVWGFGRVGRWVINDAARLQILYMRKVEMLEANGIAVAGVLAEHFNTNMLVRVAQNITARLNTILSFTVLTLVLVMLGLLETDSARQKLKQMEPRETGAAMLRACASTAQRYRRYMGVRTLMSLMTGLLVWGFARLLGLELAAEWGVIAFVLNYIPFIGPFIATLLPTFAAIAQFESWQFAIVVFLCLNLIQFLVGSYLEPRIAGSALSLSPFIVLLSVFFFSFLWGLTGAFIGVPIVIAALAVAAQFPGSRWIADLLSGPDAKAAA